MRSPTHASPRSEVRTTGAGLAPAPGALSRIELAASTLILVLLSLPFARSLDPSPSLDPSWQLGLTIAGREDLRFGRDLAFTYGPLGFLDHPTSVSIPAMALGLIYAIATVGLLYAALLESLSRRFPPPAALALTALFSVAAVRVGAPELLSMAVFVIAISLVAHDTRVEIGAPIALLFGSLAALQMLVKFSTGVVVLGITVSVVVASRKPVRIAVLSLISFVVCLAGLWMAAAQSLSDLPRWLSVTVKIASGYTSAMMSLGTPREQRIALLVLLGLAVVFALSVADVRRSRLSRQDLARLMLLAWVGWSFAKSGLVRLDPFHLVTSIVALAAMCMVVAWPAKVVRSGLAAAAVLSVVAALASEGVSSERYGESTIWGDHAASLINVGRVTRFVVDGDEHAAQVRAAKSELMASYGMEQNAQPLADRLHADPWDVSAVWALGAEWSPPPVFQAYAAYTTELDEMNASFMLGSDAPGGVLHEPKSIDRRLAPWDSPAYQLALTCRFVPDERVGVFRLLVRSENRCGQPREVARKALAPDAAVAVPRPRGDSIVAVRLTYGITWAERLQTLIMKPPGIHIVLVDDNPHRFLPGTAESLHLLRVPSRAHGRQLHWGDLDISRLQFPDSDDVTATFYEIPLHS
jgi:hypothetical protein